MYQFAVGGPSESLVGAAPHGCKIMDMIAEVFDLSTELKVHWDEHNVEVTNSKCDDEVQQPKDAVSFLFLMLTHISPVV